MMLSRLLNRLEVLTGVAVSCTGTLLGLLPNDGPFCRMRLSYWRMRGYHFGDDSVIFRNVYFLGKVTMGRSCAISNNCFLNGGEEGIDIGDYVMIGPGSTVVAFNHGFADCGIPMIKQPFEHARVVMGDDIWIGANCTVTAGVRIGTGSIVGANSAVTKDVPPFAIVGGVPARVIGSRKATKVEQNGDGV
ncbi:MAG: acyltransferase [Deltaproteobacteria bacterium]|nr:acyltransferase [Deltaproteobacteria bacterium]